MAEKLDSGAAFPQLRFPVVGGAEMTIPDDLTGDYAFVVIYRAHW